MPKRLWQWLALSLICAIRLDQLNASDARGWMQIAEAVVLLICQGGCAAMGVVLVISDVVKARRRAKVARR